MADAKPLVIAFAGPGDSSPENTEKLLDDALPDDLLNVYVPDRILRANKGLKNVVAWLEQEIEGDFSTVAKSDLVQILVKDAEDGEADAWLIYLPADGDLTSDDEELIAAALENGVRVKNLSEGLDDILLEEPGKTAEDEDLDEPVSETPATKRRGKSRGTSRSAADEAQADAETEVEAQAAQLADPCSLLGAAIYVHVRDMLIADGYLAAPKPSVFPAWCDEDGNYRPRLGRGRGRKGEKPVDLNEAEVNGIKGLREAFEGE